MQSTSRPSLSARDSSLISSSLSSSFAVHSGQSAAHQAGPGGFALEPNYTTGESTNVQRNRLERLVRNIEQSLPLPTGPRGFLLYLCGLILITGGMAILTLMSAQIAQSQRELASLNREHRLIQQQNADLIWHIARETNLERIERRLTAKGYVPVTDVQYLVVDTPLSGAERGTAHAASTDTAPGGGENPLASPTSGLPQDTELGTTSGNRISAEVLMQNRLLAIEPRTGNDATAEAPAFDTQGLDAQGLDAQGFNIEGTEGVGTVGAAVSMPTGGADFDEAQAGTLYRFDPGEAQSLWGALGDGLQRWEALFVDRPDPAPTHVQTGDESPWYGLGDSLQMELPGWQLPSITWPDNLTGWLPWMGE